MNNEAPPAMPDAREITKQVTSALRKQRGIPEPLTPEQKKAKRRYAADSHRARKKKRKRRRASARRNR